MIGGAEICSPLPSLGQGQLPGRAGEVKIPRRLVPQNFTAFSIADLAAQHLPNETKLVQFAYPSSDHAPRFWLRQAGLLRGRNPRGSGPPQAVAGYYNKAEAIRHAETLTEPWNEMHLAHKA